MSLIITDRLIIREFSLEDTEDVYKLSQEEAMKKWIPDQVYDDMEVAKEILKFLISKYEYDSQNISYPYVMGIEIKDTKKLIGHVGLSEIAEGIEIGYAIGEAYQNNGYGSEAVQAYTDWAKEQLHLPTIYGVVKSDNIASCKTLEKAGFLYRKEANIESFGGMYQRKIFIKSWSASYSKQKLRN